MVDNGIRLRDIERCFQGVVPASIVTCSPEGMPNITYLSVIHHVDDAHIALSFQFFNKTRENILHNPRAQVLVPDPLTMQQFRIDVIYERTEQVGCIFDRLRTNLDAVASQVGMSHVFRLQGADIYRVLRIEKLAHDLDLEEPQGVPNFIAALETLTARLAACDDLESLLNTTVVGLAELFDHRHSFILMTDGAGTHLYTVASHGFSDSGVGAEIPVGEGLIGAAARDRRPVRVDHLASEQVLMQAVRTSARAHGQDSDMIEIPLPGLPNVQSQIAVPIFARDRTLGVLCVQSPMKGRLTADDERILLMLGRQLAISILLMGEGFSTETPLPKSGPKGASTAAIKIKYYAVDDSIFVGDDYLIKGLSGRILYWMLIAFTRNGRTDFTNKELRLEGSLQLSNFRDNL